MAVELTISPTYLPLNQALLTGSQATDYNLWLLEMPQFWQSQFGVPILLQPHWLPLVMRTVLATQGPAPAAGFVVHLPRDQCIPDFLGNHWAGQTEHYTDEQLKSLQKDQ